MFEKNVNEDQCIVCMSLCVFIPKKIDQQMNSPTILNIAFFTGY